MLQIRRPYPDFPHCPVQAAPAIDSRAGSAETDHWIRAAPKDARTEPNNGGSFEVLIICSDIELATSADAAEISRLSRRCIERGLRPRYSPALVRKKMRGKACNVVVARKEGVLLGFGIMTYGRESANLDLLAVKKPYRRRGVGRQILQWLEKVARTAGIANIFIQVRSSNAVAIRFYERLGFQVVEQLAGYYQGREPASILCKGIRPPVANTRNVELRMLGKTIF